MSDKPEANYTLDTFHREYFIVIYFQLTQIDWFLQRTRFLQTRQRSLVCNNTFGSGKNHIQIRLSWAIDMFMDHLCISRTLRWRHNDHAGVSNHQPHGCLLNRLFRRKSKKTSKLRVTGLCVGNSPGTGEFPAQMASYAENVSIWWRHHDLFNLVAVIDIVHNSICY